MYSLHNMLWRRSESQASNSLGFRPVPRTPSVLAGVGEVAIVGHVLGPQKRAVDGLRESAFVTCGSRFLYTCVDIHIYAETCAYTSISTRPGRRSDGAVQVFRFHVARIGFHSLNRPRVSPEIRISAHSLTSPMLAMQNTLPSRSMPVGA